MAKMWVKCSYRYRDKSESSMVREENKNSLFNNFNNIDRHYYAFIWNKMKVK